MVENSKEGFVCERPVSNHSNSTMSTNCNIWLLYTVVHLVVIIFRRSGDHNFVLCQIHKPFIGDICCNHLNQLFLVNALELVKFKKYL